MQNYSLFENDLHVGELIPYLEMQIYLKKSKIYFASLFKDSQVHLRGPAYRQAGLGGFHQFF
jgi:hypothetical protein